MIDALTSKLQNYLSLSREDERLLRDAVVRVENLGASQDIIRVDEKPDYVHLILNGWACRYKYLEEGKRVILAYLIPGDLCDVHIAMLDHMDHSVGALTPIKVAYIPRVRIETLFKENNTLARAFFWTSLIEESTMREWFVNVTGRPADRRLAHLFCEMLYRHRAAKLTRSVQRFDMPLTQSELADAMGITVVHTNRVLQKLRREELVDFSNKQLTILDWEGLRRFAGFSPGYMHLSETLLEP